MTPLTYSLNEVATLLGVTQPTVSRLVQRRELPALKVGRRVLIPRDGFERWYRQRSKQPREPTLNERMGAVLRRQR